MVMLLYAGVASVFFGKCPLCTTPAQTHTQHPHTHHILFMLKLDMSPFFVLTFVLVPIALLSLISAFGGGHLYCSSEDLIETVANPTGYCVFQGHLGECDLLVLLSLVSHCIAHQGNSLALELKVKEQRPCICGIRSVYVL